MWEFNSLAYFQNDEKSISKIKKQKFLRENKRNCPHFEHIFLIFRSFLKDGKLWLFSRKFLRRELCNTQNQPEGGAATLVDIELVSPQSENKKEFNLRHAGKIHCREERYNRKYAYTNFELTSSAILRPNHYFTYLTCAKYKILGNTWRNNRNAFYTVRLKRLRKFAWMMRRMHTLSRSSSQNKEEFLFLW